MKTESEIREMVKFFEFWDRPDYSKEIRALKWVIGEYPEVPVSIEKQPNIVEEKEPVGETAVIKTVHTGRGQTAVVRESLTTQSAPCPRCKGAREIVLSEPGIAKAIACPTCKGTGVVNEGKQ